MLRVANDCSARAVAIMDATIPTPNVALFEYFDATCDSIGGVGTEVGAGVTGGGSCVGTGVGVRPSPTIGSTTGAGVGATTQPVLSTCC